MASLFSVLASVYQVLDQRTLPNFLITIMCGEPPMHTSLSQLPRIEIRPIALPSLLTLTLITEPSISCPMTMVFNLQRTMIITNILIDTKIKVRCQLVQRTE